MIAPPIDDWQRLLNLPLPESAPLETKRKALLKLICASENPSELVRFAAWAKKIHLMHAQRASVQERGLGLERTQ